MGGIHRIKRQLSKQTAMVNTGIMFEGSAVVLQVSSPVGAQELGARFRKFMGITLSRSSCVNLSDLYITSMKVREKLIDGDIEGIWN